MKKLTPILVSCRKYTGPQTNDIIREIPTEDSDNDTEESDDIAA
jgi:hypothetical protein